jgi:hypothetical protein
MLNHKDGGAQIEVGPHNTIAVGMEHLPKAEKIALKKATARRRKLVCF